MRWLSHRSSLSIYLVNLSNTSVVSWNVFSIIRNSNISSRFLVLRSGVIPGSVALALNNGIVRWSILLALRRCIGPWSSFSGGAILGNRFLVLRSCIARGRVPLFLGSATWSVPLVLTTASVHIISLVGRTCSRDSLRHGCWRYLKVKNGCTSLPSSRGLTFYITQIQTRKILWEIAPAPFLTCQGRYWALLVKIVRPSYDWW